MNKPKIKIIVIQGTTAEDFVHLTLPLAKLTAMSGVNLTAGFMEVASDCADARFEDAFTTSKFVKQQTRTKVVFADKLVFFLPLDGEKATPSCSLC